MGKIEIWEDCLVPERWFEFTYKGEDPWRVVRKIQGSIKNYFQVSAAGFGNYMLKWDNSGDPVGFYSRWWVKKELSGWSKFMMFITVEGKMNRDDKKGWFTMRFRASVNTKFEGGWIFTKLFWKIYSYIFYNRLRMNFLQRCQDWSLGFRDLVKKEYGIKSPEKFKFSPISEKGG